jgi:hypothetical protein
MFGMGCPFARSCLAKRAGKPTIAAILVALWRVMKTIVRSCICCGQCSIFSTLVFNWTQKRSLRQNLNYMDIPLRYESFPVHLLNGVIGHSYINQFEI